MKYSLILELLEQLFFIFLDVNLSLHLGKLFIEITESIYCFGSERKQTCTSLYRALHLCNISGNDFLIRAVGFQRGTILRTFKSQWMQVFVSAGGFGGVARKHLLFSLLIIL